MLIATRTRRYASPGSRIARQRLQQQRRRVARLFALVVLCCAAVILYVWQLVHAQELMRQIASHEKRLAVLSKEVAQLEEIRGKLVSFDHITGQVARELNLGFYGRRNLVVPSGLRPLIEEDERQSSGR
ncbi:MAG: hypothetical protein H5U38_13515 [Calditrichaeota bacterium]|nr:hypothetical protein [Calditrichota bacterium]